MRSSDVMFILASVPATYKFYFVSLISEMVPLLLMRIDLPNYESFKIH